MNFPTRVRNLEAYRQSVKETRTIVRQPRSGRLCSARSSGGLCAQSGGQAKTSILFSSVHRIIHYNLQLKCFKRRRA